jgi:hypothetical protein
MLAYCKTLQMNWPSEQTWGNLLILIDKCRILNIDKSTILSNNICVNGNLLPLWLRCCGFQRLLSSYAHTNVIVAKAHHHANLTLRCFASQWCAVAFKSYVIPLVDISRLSRLRTPSRIFKKLKVWRRFTKKLLGLNISTSRRGWEALTWLI